MNKADRQDLLFERMKKQNLEESLEMIIEMAANREYDDIDFVVSRLNMFDKFLDVSQIKKFDMKYFANTLNKITSNKKSNISSKTREKLKGMQSYLALNSEDKFLSLGKLDKEVTETTNYRIGSIIYNLDIDEKVKNELLVDVLFSNRQSMMFTPLFKINNDKVKLNIINELIELNKELDDEKVRLKLSKKGNLDRYSIYKILERVAMSLEKVDSFEKLPADLKNKDDYSTIPIVKALVKDMKGTKNRRKVIDYLSKSENYMNALINVEWKSDEEKLGTIKDLPLNTSDYSNMNYRKEVGAFATGIMMQIKDDKVFGKLPNKSNFFYKNGKRYVKGLREFERLQSIKPEDDKDVIDFDFPEGMTVGLEIESFGPCSMLLEKKNNTFKGWESKKESSVGSLTSDEKGYEKYGNEVTSPVLKGTRAESKKLKDILKTLKIMGQDVNEKCAGHIHINASYFTTPQSIVNLKEIVGNCEREFFIISNEPYEKPRIHGPSYYSKMYSGYISEDLKKGGKRIPRDIEKREEVLMALAKANDSGRYASLNLLHAAEENTVKNTIEFRMPNGTLNYKTWTENILLYTKLSEKCEMLGRLEDDLNNNRIKMEDLSDRQIELLSIEEKLKDSKLAGNERVDLLLDFVFNENEEKYKDIFKRRYKINSELVKQLDRKQNPFEYNTEHKREYKKEEKPANFDLKKHFYKLFKYKSESIDIIEEERDMINIAVEKERNETINDIRKINQREPIKQINKNKEERDIEK